MASDRADPTPVYFDDRNSGLVLEYKPNSTYEVVIEKQSSKDQQKWRVLNSGFVGYYYIQSVHNDYVITAGTSAENPLYCAPKKSGLDRTQLWTFREPDSGTNSRFIVMSAQTGLVMDVWKKDDKPGTRVQVFSRSNGNHQQWSIRTWMENHCERLKRQKS